MRTIIFLVLNIPNYYIFTFLGNVFLAVAELTTVPTAKPCGGGSTAHQCKEYE